MRDATTIETDLAAGVVVARRVRFVTTHGSSGNIALLARGSFEQCARWPVLISSPLTCLPRLGCMQIPRRRRIGAIPFAVPHEWRAAGAVRAQRTVLNDPTSSIGSAPPSCCKQRSDGATLP
ncbi:unnamed protein product [Ixodes persulcatus]